MIILSTLNALPLGIGAASETLQFSFFFQVRECALKRWIALTRTDPFKSLIVKSPGMRSMALLTISRFAPLADVGLLTMLLSNSLRGKASPD
jgi:hypothetical protein